MNPAFPRAYSLDSVVWVKLGSKADRAGLIGRLSQREDAAWLAELLIEIESDPDDITLPQIIEALRTL
jgi:hypothetical protein